MHVPVYLEIAAAPPPTRGQSDMTRHGVQLKRQMSPSATAFPSYPHAEGEGEKDFAYRHHDGAALR